MTPLELIIAILILGILVFVHELGHFLVAKKIGIRVEEFGFGIPPRLWGKRFGETIYSVNALPIGGFVRLSGEDEEGVDKREIKSEAEKKRQFWARSKKERAAVLLAGVAMNFFVAVVIISYIFTQGVFVPTERVHVERVVENSPATAAGLQAKDVIVALGGKDIKTSEDLILTTKEKAGVPTSIVILRNGQRQELTITPRKDPPPDQGPMGVVISNLEEKKYVWFEAPFFGTIEALKMSYYMLVILLTLIIKLIGLQPITVDVAGPIRIVEETAKAVKLGLLPTLQITGLLSLNLAIINILPIPALDGGRLLFVILEKFIGRRVKPRAEQIAHQIGFALLIGLIILISINDILRRFRG